MDPLKEKSRLITSQFGKFTVDILLRESVGLYSLDDPDRHALDESLDFLLAFEKVYRDEQPFQIPPVNEDYLLWAALILYRICQCFVFRDIGADEMAVYFESTGDGHVQSIMRLPLAERAAIIYSVDIMFRFIPSILLLVEGVASADPLVDVLRRLAGQWPLSSVGVSMSKPSRTDSFIEFPALRQLYVERIFEREALHLLEDERVAETAREFLGDHGELNPAISAVVNRYGEERNTAERGPGMTFFSSDGE